MVLLVAAVPACDADSGKLALLFGSNTHGLSRSEQQAIFDALELKVAPDGKSLTESVCEMPASADVKFLELNGDNVPEVLVTYGNTCTSGITGSSLALFVKTNGTYQSNLGFPGANVTALPERNLGYQDLLIGGPGFCFAVWRWNGHEYAFSRNEPQGPGGCDGR